LVPDQQRPNMLLIIPRRHPTLSTLIFCLIHSQKANSYPSLIIRRIERNFGSAPGASGIRAIGRKVVQVAGLLGGRVSYFDVSRTDPAIEEQLQVIYKDFIQIADNIYSFG
jgi:hypothetical protein